MAISLRTPHRMRRAFLALACAAAATAAPDDLPAPLQLEQATRYAAERRPEIAAAAQRAAALGQRPAIVGSLEDPMIFTSIDHYPFNMMEGAEVGRRYDWSASVEQRFPLSGVLGHRRRAARAAAELSLAEVERTRLDVVLQAQEAYFMLLERRRMVEVLERQLALAQQMVDSATSRYSAGTGLQADVLRAEVETARVTASQRALSAQTRAAEAMLNASLGRSPAAGVPELGYELHTGEPAPAPALATAALRARPELRAGRSELARAAAEIDVMRSMYRPMAMVRAGHASTMAEGTGAMLMIGVSIPLWRGRLSAGVNEARAMERMAQADLLGMELMIEGETAAAREDVIAALVQVDSLRLDIVPRAEMAVDSSLAAYAAGRGTLVTVLEAARTLWEARSELVMTEAAAARARARLDRTVGSTGDIRR